jgi:hypothetical protein
MKDARYRLQNLVKVSSLDGKDGKFNLAEAKYIILRA